MALEQKKKVIGETTYLVTQMDGIRALKTQTKLATLLGSNVGKLNVDMPDDFSMSNIQSLLPVIGSVLAGTDSDDLSGFILSLFETGVFTEENKAGQTFPQKVDFNDHFGGKMSEMWQVVAFIFEVNFALGNE